MKARNTKEDQGFETNYEFVFAFLSVVFVPIIFLLARLIQLQHDKIIWLTSNPKKAEEKSTSSNPPPEAGKAPAPAEGGLLYWVSKFLECQPETAALYQATKIPDSEPEVESDSKKASDLPIEAESLSTPPSSPQAEESPEKSTEEAVPTKLAPTAAPADTDTTPYFSGGKLPFLNLNGGHTGSYKETEDSPSTSTSSPTPVSEKREPSEAPEKTTDGGLMGSLTNICAFAIHPNNLKNPKTTDGSATDAEATADDQLDSDPKKASASQREAEFFSTPPSSPQAEGSPKNSTEEAVPTKPAPTTTAPVDIKGTPSFSGGPVPFLNLNGGPTGSYNTEDLWNAALFAAHLGYELGSSRPRQNSASQPSTG